MCKNDMFILEQNIIDQKSMELNTFELPSKTFSGRLIGFVGEMAALS